MAASPVPGSKFHSAVAHDAVVYYCKKLGLTWLLGCWRTSTNWKECALTAPVGEGYAICSCSRTRTRTRKHHIESSQTFALFYLHTSASSLAATPGVSKIITTMMMMRLKAGEGGKGKDIGMHKIYRLKLSQRLEAFKNDMSERLRCRKGVPYTAPLPLLLPAVIIIIIIIIYFVLAPQVNSETEICRSSSAFDGA